MNFKKISMVLMLFIVLICCFAAVSASEDVNGTVSLSDDGAMDVVSEIDSGDGLISSQNGEFNDSVDDSSERSLAESDVSSDSTGGGTPLQYCLVMM